ncbi:MAG: C4-type zinc ribbon domain-containing protein [Syntrophotaleaceae bacterium]
MEEQMQLLKNLQGLDRELGRLRENRQKLEKEQLEIGADLERIQTMIDSLTADIELIEAQREELRKSLNLEKANVEKAEGRLPEIKTQKEYLAVLKEIDAAKKVNKDLSDRIQEKEKEIGALEQERKEKQESLDALKEQVRERCEEIRQSLQDSEQVLAEKNSQRDTHLEPLPVPLRKRYQLLMERRAGIAVVEARNGTCLGCNMHLPPQLFNSLFRSQEIQCCPHCNRLLYVEKED